MRKRIALLGFILMSPVLPLYADFSNSGPIALENPPFNLHLQIAASLITGTGHFSILDTRRPLDPANPSHAGSSLIAPFKVGNPVVPVPEPTHYVLMGLGVVGLFLARRDRLNAK